MKTDKQRKTEWMSDQDWAGVSPNASLNESCTIQDLNALRESIDDLREQLDEAEGHDRIDILTSLVGYDLRSKTLIHIILKELIPELRRIHHQGYDLHNELVDADHPFCNQHYESLTGFALHRDLLRHLMMEE